MKTASVKNALAMFATIARKDSDPPSWKLLVLNVGNWWALLLYTGLGLIKSLPILPSGRLWAEDGVVWFTQLSGKGLTDALTTTYLGSYYPYANLLGWASGLVPLDSIGLLLSIGALPAQLLGFTMLLTLVSAYNGNLLTKLLLAIAATSLPQSNEVWLTVTNAYWHFAVAAIAVTALPTAILSAHRLWIFPICAICALSGMPPNFVVIALLVRFAVERKKVLIWVAAIFLVGMLLQLCVAATSGLGQRSLGTPLELMLQGAFIQQLLAPVVGSRLADSDVIPWIRAYGWVGVTACGAIWITVIALLSLQRKNRGAQWLALTGAIFLLITYFAALNPKEALLSATGHARYSYAPTLTLVAALCLYVQNLKSSMQWVLYAPLLMMVAGLRQLQIPYEMANPHHDASILQWQRTCSDSLAIAPANWFIDTKSLFNQRACFNAEKSDAARNVRLVRSGHEASNISKLARCSIDQVHAFRELNGLVNITLNGWMDRREAKDAKAQMWVEFLDGSHTAQVIKFTGEAQSRPDVSKALAIPALLDSGFHFNEKLTIARTISELRIRIRSGHTDDGLAVECESELQIRGMAK